MWLEFEVVFFSVLVVRVVWRVKLGGCGVFFCCVELFFNVFFFGFRF